MKDALNKLVNESVIAESRGTPALLAAVLLKYGIAPIACIYLGYILMIKDKLIEKNSDQLVMLVKEQTSAMVKQTEVQQGLIQVINANTEKLKDFEKDRLSR